MYFCFCSNLEEAEKCIEKETSTDFDSDSLLEFKDEAKHLRVAICDPGMRASLSR